MSIKNEPSMRFGYLEQPVMRAHRAIKNRRHFLGDGREPVALPDTKPLFDSRHELQEGRFLFR